MYSYLIELQIQNQSPRTTPNWFQDLENNFKNLVCKNYNRKVSSLKEQYQKSQHQREQYRNNMPITPVSDIVDDNKKVSGILTTILSGNLKKSNF